MFKTHCGLFRSLGLATFSLLVTALSGWAQPEVTMLEDELPELRQHLHMALRNSPRMIIKQAESAASLADYDAAKAGQYPTFGGWANYLRSEDDRNEIGGSRPATKLGYNFSIRQPLYYWGNIKRGVRNAEIYTLIDQGRTRQAYMTLAGDIRSAYLDLIIQLQALNRHRFKMEQKEKKLADTREKRAQNLNSEADLYHVEIDYERSSLDLMAAQDRYNHLIKVYSRLTGLPPLTEDEIPADFPAAPADSTRKLLALSTRFLATEMPENTKIQILKREIEISENNVENTRNSLRPKFDLTAGISQDEQDYALGTNDYEYQSIYGGVTLNWTLFDSFATKARVKAGLAHLRAAEARLELEQEKLIDEVHQLGRMVERRARMDALNHRELVSAQNHLDYTRGRFDRGEASISEVNDAQLNLDEKLGYSLISRYEYWNNISQMLRLIESDPVLDVMNAHQE